MILFNNFQNLINFQDNFQFKFVQLQLFIAVHFTYES